MTATSKTTIDFSSIASHLASSYRAAGRSQKTVESYTDTLRQFHNHLVSTGRSTDPDDATIHDVEDWVAGLRMTRSPATARTRFVTLRACWRWMLKRGYVESDIFVGIDTPTADQRVLRVLSDDEVRSIIATTDGPGFLNRRDRALLLVAADTGMRRGELAGALIDDLDLATGRLLLRGTKANRDRQVALGGDTVAAVRRWMRERDRLLAGRDQATIFVSRVGEPMTGWGVHQVFEARTRQAGVHVERAVHAWRSWAAIKMLDAGASEAEVMALLGWSSHQMLVRYQRGRAADRALRRHASFSPVSGL